MPAPFDVKINGLFFLHLSHVTCILEFNSPGINPLEPTKLSKA